MRKPFLLLALASVLLLSCQKQQPAPEPEKDSSAFVNLTDIIPDAVLEIRYYSTYNFVGERIDGYEQPVALMTRQAADSLKAVSDELKSYGYRLKIWDAYRPQTAVNHFIRWAENVQDTAMKKIFYPMVDKSLLFEQRLQARNWTWVHRLTGSAKRAILLTPASSTASPRTASSCVMPCSVTASSR